MKQRDNRKGSASCTIHSGLIILSVAFLGPFIRRRCRVVGRVVADDFDDLDETERGPQPAEDRKLVIVDLGHTTMMPPSSLEHRAAALAGVTRDSIYI